MALSHNPRKQFKILKQMGIEWKKINQQALRKAIKSLYSRHLLDFKESSDGAVILIISKDGKRLALNYKIDDMTIKHSGHWDFKWRLVMFDIPEKYKKIREAMRSRLNQLGFYKLQNSVFVFPYHCENEIEFLIEFYNIRHYVRQITAEYIDNALHLKEIFKL